MSLDSTVRARVDRELKNDVESIYPIPGVIYSN